MIVMSLYLMVHLFVSFLKVVLLCIEILGLCKHHVILPFAA